MPRGDRTGPGGMGPMTGRAVGYCAGSPDPGYVNPGIGRGCRIGRGFGGGGGWGRRNLYYATGLPGWARYGTYGAPFGPDPCDEPDAGMRRVALQGEADALQAQLDLVKKRLSDLEKTVTPE
jgi:Family of unknown function (DUF5320)